jgi:ATP-dependent Lhr-like helicase
MTESQTFTRLHESIQRWIWKQKWPELRPIQEASVEPILSRTCDVIISAPTASGKTEAAFLPACSQLLEDSKSGVGILYIAPLKALINDQTRRLESLAEITNLKVTPWHGDVSRSIKKKQLDDPSGILLITPESLESLLMSKMGWCSKAFQELQYIIIDEFHVFLGTERGQQLQSLMSRLEFLLQKTIPRIALSATFGEVEKMGSYLRPTEDFPFKLIETKEAHSELKVQLRGYLDHSNPEEEKPRAIDAIISDLFSILRGKSNLIFANSRNRTEQIAASLLKMCETGLVPNEFFPHHGSLSKEIRESLESRLQQGKFPTTAVCTTTLELGIDIGAVDSIAQVRASPSVVSLRQRLGRSGRRGEAAILRLFIEEDEITQNSHVLDRLRLHTVQTVAMVNLLLKKWYEPPAKKNFHFSTLIQQTLSVIYQYGGVRANQLWDLLCNKGPFNLVDQALYSDFLKSLGEKKLISQMHDGQLVLGEIGEKLTNHYTFYSAFQTPEEYRLEFDGKILGSIPVDKPLIENQLVIFAGKYWIVQSISDSKKLITLKKAKGGEPPCFGGNGQYVHNIIREEMYRVYLSKDCPIYLDGTAKSSFHEGMECFHSLDLSHKGITQIGKTTFLFSWLGDYIVYTIVFLLRGQGLKADAFGGVIDISNCSSEILLEAISNILKGAKPTEVSLASVVADTVVEKHDLYLSNELRNLGYGSRSFDVEGAWKWLGSFIDRK